MTTFIALSPRRRTAHDTWLDAQNALVDDALHLATKRRDRAERDLFDDVAVQVGAWTEQPESTELRTYDVWCNPITFRLIVQEQMPV